ncbi:MAG TPA: arginine--tRNA ligase [Bacillota bacterium]|nr:arginine--tRNA ligase [Bacillota bacterium]
MDHCKEEISRVLAPLVMLEESRIAGLLEEPPAPEMGDLAFPCFTLAAQKKQSPAAIAAELGEALSGRRGECWEKAVARGPYLNFYLDYPVFSRDLLKKIYEAGSEYGRSNLGKGGAIVIDYSSPNICKPFGIGHIRSTVIGHALCLILEAQGYRTIGINHLGDWGTQFGKMIVAYERWGDDEKLQQDPVNYLYHLYVRFHQEAEKNDAFEEEARAWFKRLEDGEEEAVNYWQLFRRLSLENYDQIYDLLGLKFDYYHGESHYNDMLDDVIRMVQEKGVAVESEGALIVDLEKYGLPPAMLRKKDGATLYLTRDLAAAQYRHRTFNFVKALYVVGAEQKLHFQQMVKILEQLGFSWAQDCIHIPFGLIRFKEGRMSTREGKMILLEEVLQKAINLAREIIEEKNPGLADKESAARMVGLGAVRFGDLSNDRVKDVEFDWDKVLDFSGETAAYIQYAHARICSILRRSGSADPAWSDEAIAALGREEEKALVKTLAAYPEKIEASAASYRPSILARYLVDVARDFNRFYHECPVLVDDPELRRARLLLILAVRQVLKNGLGLLGIAAPEEM